MIGLDEAWANAWAPPDRRDIHLWAECEVTMPTIITKRDPITGRFTSKGSRHFIAPLQALKNGRVRGVRVCAPVRGGKTLIADLYAPWAVSNDNASVLWVFQDEAIAKRHAETRQGPIFSSIKAIGALRSIDRHKTRTTDFITADGRPITLRGPAFGGLQSVGYQVIIGDEAWRYAPGTIAEMYGRIGDALKIERSKALFISQGGEPDSDWDLEYRAGVEYVWHVPCAGCGVFLPPEWTGKHPDGKRYGFVYDKILKDDDSLDVDKTSRTGRFVCAHCGHEHKPGSETWAKWDEGGIYLRTSDGAPFDPDNVPTEVSFRWTALIDFPWHELLKIWLKALEAKAVGNYTALVAFWQKRMALMRNELQLHTQDVQFARIAMPANPASKSDDELARFLTCDRQGEDLFWCSARSLHPGGESRRLWTGRLYSFADIEAKRIELGINEGSVGIDSGYNALGDVGVYEACIRYGWIALKGVGLVAGFWHQEPPAFRGDVPRKTFKPWAPEAFGDPGRGTAQEGQRSCLLIRFSSDQMATMVDRLVKLGRWKEPEGVDESDEIEQAIKTHMSAEYLVPKSVKGRVVNVRVCPTGENHLYDVAKMFCLMACVTGLMPGELLDVVEEGSEVGSAPTCTNLHQLAPTAILV